MRNLNLFNEKIYLEKEVAKRNRNEEALRKAQLNFIDDYYREKLAFRDVFLQYNHYIQNLLEFITHLNIGKNDLENAMIFHYLLSNGYISPQQQDIVQPFTYKIGINALIGKKNPLNIARLYYDTFKSKYSYPLEYPCFISDKSNSFSARRNIANYAINIVLFQNALYGYDIKENKLYISNGAFEMRLMSEDSKRFLRYKPLYEFISKSDNFHRMNDIDKTLAMFDYSSYKSIPLTQEAINELYYDLIARLTQYTQELASFADESHEAIKTMQRKVLSKTR